MSYSYSTAAVQPSCEEVILSVGFSRQNNAIENMDKMRIYIRCVFCPIHSADNISGIVK